MPRPIVCPHCQEELDIPEEFRGRQVRCAVCKEVFVPPLEQPSSRAGEQPYERRSEAPAARRVRRNEPNDDDDRGQYSSRDRDDDRWNERPTRKKKKGSTLWVWLLILGFFGMCVLPCGGFIVFSVMLAFPDFEPYTSAEGRYRAEFPGTPYSFPQTTDDGQTRQCTEYKRGFPPETYFIHYTDFTGKAANRDAKTVLDEEVKKVVAKQVNITGHRTMPSSYDGYPSLDLTIDYNDGTVTVSRYILVNRRLYVVGVTGASPLSMEDPRVSHFLDAFKVTSTGPEMLK